ncbi:MULTISPECIES: hypothetical protein [Flavobacteriaceae]|uniref:hypothetical protein n=1 Tax=Flavobacteriaceae TaxID=49546 RepID=UPI001493146E|nr:MULTISPECIES: hypothetical protein [Allomuricauda]MDC6365050.1 hypothetical protein [Muricauda sp. AC10]
MKKHLVRYFFFLSTLILGGFINHLNADTAYGIGNANDCEEVTHYILDHANISSPLHRSEKNFFTEITDVEEQEEKDENESSRTTYTKCPHNLISHFSNPFSGAEFSEFTGGSGYFKQYPTASLKLHIQFQVFRI